MDASCKIQGSIHVFRLVNNMCPGKWVHIKTRLHFFNPQDRYMIVLEKRKTYYLLITAYYIEYDNTLNKKIREYKDNK